jgi:hypothetical protein
VVTHREGAYAPYGSGNDQPDEDTPVTYMGVVLMKRPIAVHDEERRVGTGAHPFGGQVGANRLEQMMRSRRFSQATPAGATFMRDDYNDPQYPGGTAAH